MVTDNSLFSFAFIYSDLILWICIIILLISGVFLWKEKTDQLKHAHREKEEILLKYQLLQGQLNPHFFFNGLNTIQGLFVNNQVKEGNEVMGHFSDLIRKVFEQVDWDSHLISEELETLKLYIEIEKRRLENDIEVRLINNSNLNFDNLLIPPLVLQPILEHIIWHSIVPKKSKGMIEVIFSDSQKLSHLNIQINFDGKHISINELPLRVKIAIERLGEKGNFKIANQSNELGITVLFRIPIKRHD